MTEALTVKRTRHQSVRISYCYGNYLMVFNHRIDAIVFGRRSYVVMLNKVFKEFHLGFIILLKLNYYIFLTSEYLGNG